MTDVTIKGGLTQDNAILLLAAAEELELDAGVVRTTRTGFVAPQEVADKAGVEFDEPDVEPDTEEASDDESEETDDDEATEAPAKKAPAKKAAAKKTAASKE